MAIHSRIETIVGHVRGLAVAGEHRLRLRMQDVNGAIQDLYFVGVFEPFHDTLVYGLKPGSDNLVRVGFRVPCKTIVSMEPVPNEPAAALTLF